MIIHTPHIDRILDSRHLINNFRHSRLKSIEHKIHSVYIIDSKKRNVIFRWTKQKSTHMILKKRLNLLAMSGLESMKYTALIEADLGDNFGGFRKKNVYWFKWKRNVNRIQSRSELNSLLIDMTNSCLIGSENWRQECSIFLAVHSSS